MLFVPLLFVPLPFLVLEIARVLWTAKSGLSPDCWRIEELPNSFELLWRPQWAWPTGGFSLYRLFSNARSRLVVQIGFAALCVCLSLAGELGLFRPSLAFMLSAHACLVWLIMDLELNAERRVRIPVSGNLKVDPNWGAERDSDGNVFPAACLSSVRLAPTRAGPKRFRLVFQTPSRREVQLVGFPGLPEDVACDLRDAVLGLVGAKSGQAGKRTMQCSGLAIKSVGVDNPLVASR